MKAALEAWLGEKLGTRVVLDEWRRHAEGFSWQTYTFLARFEGSALGLAVRREPEDGLLAPYDIEGQYRLHAALEALGTVPVPGLRWLELDPAVIGMPFYVMDRVDGHVPVQWKPDDPIAFPDEAARRRVGEEFVDVLAAIHALDWRATGLPGPRDEVAHWERLLDEAVLVEVPLLREAIAWLRAHPASSGRVALVHGDYRIGNFILGADGRIAAIFDWELAHVGDPVEDVALAAIRLYRGRTGDVSGLLPLDEWLAAYADAAGVPVPAQALRFWTVFGLARAAVTLITASALFASGATRDLRYAALGHQVHYLLRFLLDELDPAQAEELGAGA
jgi:aminoglycoside phosphotransferase (APT) family kinase protein